MGVLYPNRCTDGVKFDVEEGPPPCQISPPSVQRVATAGRKTSKSASLSKLNTGALRCANAAGNDFSIGLIRGLIKELFLMRGIGRVNRVAVLI